MIRAPPGGANFTLDYHSPTAAANPPEPLTTLKQPHLFLLFAPLDAISLLHQLLQTPLVSSAALLSLLKGAGGGPRVYSFANSPRAFPLFRAAAHNCSLAGPG